MAEWAAAAPRALSGPTFDLARPCFPDALVGALM